ncbi:MAG: hypothetical protein ACYS15_02985 [Planctomycetota bacterium]
MNTETNHDLNVQKPLIDPLALLGLGIAIGVSPALADEPIFLDSLDQDFVYTVGHNIEITGSGFHEIATKSAGDTMHEQRANYEACLDLARWLPQEPPETGPQLEADQSEA